jgi:hypothetical protein
MERRAAPPDSAHESGPDGGAHDAAARVAQETKHVAQTAGEQTGEVAGTVKAEAASVVQTAKDQGRNVAHEAREQARTQANAQTERLAGALRNVGQQVEALAEGRADEAGPARDYARQAATTVQAWAGKVESRGFQGLTHDLEQIARRRPGAFLAGAAAAGFLIGRFLRSASASSASGGNGATGWQTPPTMARAEPTALPPVEATALAGEFAPTESGPMTRAGR